MPLGILTSPMCNVKQIATKHSRTSNNFENLEINDVLENIKVLLKYIRKKK